MLGLFRLRYYFGLRPTSPIECKPSRSATYSETQPPDWVLSFKSKEIFTFQGMRASPYHSAIYIETQPLD
ncbi:hypothetical protein THZB04_330001 [Vibrio owensii]|nr:hypothetical protein THZB04_330001 [Vibrio owensii]